MCVFAILVYIFLFSPPLFYSKSLSLNRESVAIKYHQSDHEETGLRRKLFRFFKITNSQSKSEVEKYNSNSIDKYNTIFAKWSKIPRKTKCFSVPETPADRRINLSRLRVASYNVEWLFLFGGRGSVRCPGKSCPWSSDSEARDHFIKTADLLLKMDADIIHLNEVEDCRILGAILDFLPDNHGYRAYMIDGTDTMTGQNVAILSKIDPVFDLKRTENRAEYPVEGSTCGSHVESRIRGNKRRSRTMGLSKHYITRFNIPLNDENSGRSFDLILAGAHFIAFPSDIERCKRREAQATVLSRLIHRELLSRPEQQTELIITGDFNDHDGEIMGANAVKPLSTVLQILKQSHSLKSAAAHINDPLHRYSSWHDLNRNCRDDGPPEHSLIDHILVSKGLSDRIISVWMDHNTTVSCTDRISDHWPIIVDIRT